MRTTENLRRRISLIWKAARVKAVELWVWSQAQSCRLTGNHHIELMWIRGLYEVGETAAVKYPVLFPIVSEGRARVSIELPDGRVFGHAPKVVADEYHEVCMSCRKAWTTRVQHGGEVGAAILLAFAAQPTLGGPMLLRRQRGRPRPVVPAIKAKFADKT